MKNFKIKNANGIYHKAKTSYKNSVCPSPETYFFTIKIDMNYMEVSLDLFLEQDNICIIWLRLLVWLMLTNLFY